ETGPGAANDAHARGFVAVGRAQGVEELRAELVAERVPLLGPGERDAADQRPRRVHGDQAVGPGGRPGHARSSGREPRKSARARSKAAGWARWGDSPATGLRS